MIRAFLAVEPSPELQATFAHVQQDLKQSIEQGMNRNIRISWVQPGKVHLTLKFLGEMEEQMIDPLHAVLRQALGTQTTLSVPLERLGGFPGPHNPRVLWIGPSETWEKDAEAKRVAEIHGVVEQACEGLGFLREVKPFSPHLTLARIKAGERRIGVSLAKSGLLDRPLALGSLAMGSVLLMKSDLKPTGSVYTKLWEVKIGEQRVLSPTSPTVLAPRPV